MSLSTDSAHFQLVSDYWKRFGDESDSKLAVESDGGIWTASMPNGSQLEIDPDDPVVDWMEVNPRNQDSNRLWVNSLRFLIPILEAGDTDVVVAVFKSFQEHLTHNASRADLLKSASIGHQSALQLRTFSEARAWIARQLSSDSEFGPASLRGFDEVLCTCVDLVCELVNELDLLKPNNHGMMLGTALLHAEIIYGDLERFEGESDAEEFLYSSLTEILGEDGFANENTPLFQGTYIRLLDEICEFQTWAGGASIDRFVELADKAQSTYRHFVIPGGTIAPIGDASASAQSRFSPSLGAWASSANGVFISSSDSTFLSFVCGYRGVFHKQLDDTSIILWHKGEFLLQDAGLASYDKSDQVSVSIRGQLGHSGLFFREFDAVKAESVVSFGTGTRAVKSKMTVNSRPIGFSAQVTGNVGYRGTQIKRQVSLVDDNRFLIWDEVHSSPHAKDPVSRFLLDPAATVEVQESGALVVKNAGVWMSLYSPSGLATAEFFRGDVDGPAGPRGFLAPKNYVKEPTTLIDIPLPLSGEGSGKRLIFVAYGSIAEGIKVWNRF